MRKAIVAVCLPLVAGVALAQAMPSSTPAARGAQAQRPVFVPTPRGLNVQTLKVCAGELPSGWIKVDDEWNPGMCGNPAGVVLNMWTLERHETRIVGTSLLACAGPVPNGWTLVEAHWDPARCGRPGQPQANVMTIRRVH